MKRKLRKVHGLLGRYQFVDLAEAISIPLESRKDHLRVYLDRALDERGRMASYEQFRRAVPDIYGVVRPFDPGALDLDQIRTGIRANCHPNDVDSNLEVCDLLFGFVRSRGYRPYEHPAHDLRISAKRKVAIRINHYVVDGERGVFQFVYPRRDPLLRNRIELMASLIHQNYVFGDFEAFDVEIVDLSCPAGTGPRGGHVVGKVREPRIHLVRRDQMISREELTPHVHSVHDLLLEIGEEP